MIIPDVEQWAKAHAGRKVKWNGGTPSKPQQVTSTVVGYRKAKGIDQAVIIVYGRVANTISGYKGLDFGGHGTAVVDVSNLNIHQYAWLEPRRIELVGTETDEFLRKVFTVEQPAFKKKEISPYPHKCPKCKGPAYIGFNTTVDCQRKCGSKTE